MIDIHKYEESLNVMLFSRKLVIHETTGVIMKPIDLVRLYYESALQSRKLKSLPPRIFLSWKALRSRSNRLGEFLLEDLSKESIIRKARKVQL
jgi:hypothetical protein